MEARYLTTLTAISRDPLACDITSRHAVAKNTRTPGHTPPSIPAARRRRAGRIAKRKVIGGYMYRPRGNLESKTRRRRRRKRRDTRGTLRCASPADCLVSTATRSRRAWPALISRYCIFNARTHALAHARTQARTNGRWHGVARDESMTFVTVE